MIIPPAYINRDGFITVVPYAPHVPGEGNGWLQTGLAYACGHIELEYRTMLLTCQATGMPLIWRSPHKRNADDDQAHDDYWAALLLDRSWAGAVLRYAEKNDWDFAMRPEDKGKAHYLFSRFPHFPPFVRLAAGAELSPMDRAILWVSALVDALSIGQADGNMKAFCRLHLTVHLWGFGPLASLWWWRIRRRYGTIGESWAAYFGHGHPLNGYNGE